MSKPPSGVCYDPYDGSTLVSRKPWNAFFSRIWYATRPDFSPATLYRAPFRT